MIVESVYFRQNMALLLTVGLLLENSQHGTWRAFKNELPDSDLTVFSPAKAPVELPEVNGAT